MDHPLIRRFVLGGKNSVKALLQLAPPVEYFVRLFVLRLYVFFKFLNYNPKGNGIRILLVNHHFDQDIEALSDAAGERNIAVISHKAVFGLSNCYFSEKEKDGLVPYSSIPNTKKEAYRKTAEYIIRLLRNKFQFDVMVLPSDSFYWIREVVLELKSMGIPTVVIDKEGTISPYFFESHPKEINEKFPFISDRILVWSERQKHFWNRAGVPDDLISVVGQPRSDFFFNKSKWPLKPALGLPADKKVVLFFSFDRDAYIPYSLYKDGLNWDEMFFKTHSILKEIAREFKDVCFIVKTHPQQRDYSLILREFSDKSPNTVLLSGAQISNQLIVNSDVVVGFQSTALIETMLLNIPILYPFWGKSAEKFSNQLIPFHFSNAVDTCQSPEILGHNLKAYIENPRTIEKVQRVARQKFLEEYMYKVDGHASGRALSEIDKSLHIPEKNNFQHLISIAE